MNLQEFLNANPIEGMKTEVPISDRLRDENGKLYLFEIKVIDQETYSLAQKEAMTIDVESKKVSVDTFKMALKIAIEGCAYPNFKSAKDLEIHKCSTPEQYISKVLKPGEIMELADQIRSLSGFSEDIKKLEDEVKNY